MNIQQCDIVREYSEYVIDMDMLVVISIQPSTYIKELVSQPGRT